MTNGWGPVEKDKSNGENGAGDGATLTLNGITYAKGLGAHALSDVRYAIGPTCTRLLASVGVDDEVGGNGSVVFQVFAGATKVFDSGTMGGTTATKSVDVSIAARSEIRLVLTDAGNGNAYDHGDWAHARFVCGRPDGHHAAVGHRHAPAAGATSVAARRLANGDFLGGHGSRPPHDEHVPLVKQGQTTPSPATVFDCDPDATLDPSAAWPTTTVYTATVDGGTTGGKDVAGNPLAADFTWTFTTRRLGKRRRPTSAISPGPR